MSISVPLMLLYFVVLFLNTVDPFQCQSAEAVNEKRNLVMSGPFWVYVLLH